MTDAAFDTRSHKSSTREALLQPMLAHAAFDGWTAATFEAARREAGIGAGEAELACPRKELDMLAHWSRQLDAAVLDAVKAGDLSQMKIRDRVRFGVMARLTAIGEHEEAARRARARLMLPDAGAEGAQLLWATADTIWRAIGDTSTDVNFYTKRTILAGVYGTTLATWLGETDAAKPEAQTFLDRRIQNVMDFEKAKAQLQRMTADMPDMAGFLGKLRYGPGPRA
jgi:ubiquinone biosynthesis protein COQ9